jgi:hypothetical protein
MNTFKQFANQTIKASPILTEEEIEALLQENNIEPLFKYAYRIAGFVSVYVRRKAPARVDETDWQDAVQECMVKFPEILKSYSKTEAPFLRYMSRAFQTIIREYLWTTVKGGTGKASTGAQTIEHLDHVVGEWGTFDLPLDCLHGEMLIHDDSGSAQNAEHTVTFSIPQSAGFTTRDPLVELMAEEAIYRALRYAARHPKPGPKEW